MLRIALITSLALLGLFPATFAGAADRAAVSGPARVIDGDTFEVRGVHIRLHGIDAVENDQSCGGQGSPMWPCGAWVAGEVRSRYQGRVLDCFRTATDRYGRMVAVCYDNGTDVNRALVRSGLAFAYQKYSMAYVAEERAARRARSGLFGTGVMTPAAFRAAKRDGHQAQKARRVPKDCPIKGNINSKGVRIYHQPGQVDYAATVITPAKGERYFCNEAEARRAGWRAAKR